MKDQKRILVLLLSLALMLGMIPAAVFAQDGPSPEGGLPGRKLFGNNEKSDKAYLTGGSLTGTDRKIYTALINAFSDIAAGRRSSTVVSITAAELGLDRELTAQDLGVSTLTESGNPTNETWNAIFDLLGANSMSIIIDCLLTDLPYDAYWYDKVAGYMTDWDPDFTWTDSAVDLSGCGVTVYFSAVEGYSSGSKTNVNTDEDPYYMYLETDTALTAATKAATDNALAIVQANAGNTDYEKVLAYKDAICDLTEYNYDAAYSSDPYYYGNPWQLVWVFDKDPSTNVVCEGYSKAFQYLCDLSTFKSDLVCCWSVYGYMDGGAHMWNILRMDDGRYYFVDVTNCDGDDESFSIGYPDLLFLKGWEEKLGDGDYLFDCGWDQVEYRYSNDLYEFISSDVLGSISKVDYDPGNNEPDEFYAKPMGYQEGETAYIIMTPQSVDHARVDAYSSKGALTYEWFVYDPDSTSQAGYSWFYLEDSEQVSVHDTYVTISDPDRPYFLWCEVTNSAGDIRDVYFYITVHSGLSCDQPNGSLFITEIGEDQELVIEASADYGEVSIEWYRQILTAEGIDFERIDGADGNTYLVKNVTSFGRFFAVVSDDYGNYRELEFDVIPLKVISVQYGEDVLVEGSVPDYGLEFVSAWIVGDTEVYEDTLSITVENVTEDIYVIRADMLDQSYEDPIGAEAYLLSVVSNGSFLKGDVNEDGQVTADDLTQLSRYVAQIETDWSSNKLAAADVNEDGTVDANDLTMLSRYVAGIITKWE